MAKYDRWLTEDGLSQLRGWARAGLTNAQIAHNCGISRDTLDAWCKRFPGISDTLKAGKEVADLEVENALYRSAVGFAYEEKIFERKLDGEMVHTRTVSKQAQPNVTAQIFWLKNRRRDVWKDSPDRAEIEREKLEMEKHKAEAEQAPAVPMVYTFSITEGTATVDEVMG